MRVALQVTCLNDALFPEVGRATVALLERLGVEVDFPEDQTCCGQPMVNTGYLDEAIPAVRRFTEAFAGYDAIVTPSGSCAGSVRHQHSIVARRSGDQALAARVAELAPRTYELTEFLVDVLGVEDVGARFPHTVTYHPTCHSLRMLGVGDRPTRLLSHVAGLTLADLPAAEECCGFGGHLRGQELRHLRGHGRRQGRSRARDGRGGPRRGRLLLPDAPARAARPAALRRPRDAPRRDPGRAMTTPGTTHGTTPGTATFVGMPPFPEAAREALGNSQLRHNLQHATHTIRDKRARVVAEVEDWEDLRTRGAAVKDAALAELDQHLLTLEAALQANGAVVHWARDADEACRVVAEVARSHGADEVLKVKSMATQEIELNEALARQGIQAWETDLAELIVQLGDDLPSHILVPAIHRNRAEIREIFQQKMAAAGRPAPDDLTDEPAALASAARLHLREKFLRAKVGVSGANFAVAETGTLVVVESEGNGRMCLTLPDVLVSVVGIEKVVPTFDDLDVFLRLLPRSSTGERMNPYTSMWSGVTPGDGPQEVHVVLLDNGRTRVAGRRDRAAGAAVHPLLGLPQRLPGLRAGRRPCLRLDVPRPDRRHPQPPAARRRPRSSGRLAAVRVVPLRRLLRGVPGQDRHPVGAGRPAGPGRRRASRRPALRDGPRHEGCGRDVLLAAAARPGRAVLPGGHDAGPPLAAGHRLERRARRAGRAEGVVPRLVEADPPMSARDEVLARVRAALRTPGALPVLIERGSLREPGRGP